MQSSQTRALHQTEGQRLYLIAANAMDALQHSRSNNKIVIVLTVTSPAQSTSHKRRSRMESKSTGSTLRIDELLLVDDKIVVPLTKIQPFKIGPILGKRTNVCYLVVLDIHHLHFLPRGGLHGQAWATQRAVSDQNGIPPISSRANSYLLMNCQKW